MCHGARCTRGMPALKHQAPTEIKIAGIKVAYVSFYKCTWAIAAESVSADRDLSQLCESNDDAEHQQRAIDRGLLVVRLQFKGEQLGELYERIFKKPYPFCRTNS